MKLSWTNRLDFGEDHVEPGLLYRWETSRNRVLLRLSQQNMRFLSCRHCFCHLVEIAHLENAVNFEILFRVEIPITEQGSAILLSVFPTGSHLLRLQQNFVLELYLHCPSLV